MLVFTLQEDQEDLEHIVYTELSKYEKERIKNANIITKDITEVRIYIWLTKWYL